MYVFVGMGFHFPIFGARKISNKWEAICVEVMFCCEPALMFPTHVLASTVQLGMNQVNH